QLRRVLAIAVGNLATPAVLDLQIAASGPAQLLQRLQERRVAGLRHWVVGGQAHEEADTPHPFTLLRARRERPCYRAAEQCDEVASPHRLIPRVGAPLTLPHRCARMLLAS